ncbi:MAG: GNAT family N-acetyltransferase [Blastocatellia bacterium]
MKLIIRRAEQNDAGQLTQVAFAAKQLWGYPESWLEAWREDLTITPGYIARHKVFAATEQDKPVGFYALATSEGMTELDHLWVLPELIGKGVGRQLLNHALELATAMGAQRIEIDSDPNAEGFYLKAGAKKIGEVISTIEGRERKLPRLAIDTLKTGDTPK